MLCVCIWKLACRRAEMWARGVRSLHRKFSSSSEGRDVVIHNRNAAVPHLLPHHPYSAPSPIPTAHSNFRLCCASAALLSLTAGATVLVFPRGGEDEEEEEEHHGHGRANLQPHIAKFNNRLERIAEAISERSKSAYAHALETGVAAMVLFRSLKSVLSSANQDARLGLDSWLKFRVAALLADLSGANESRRTAIVHAGGGAVVDWLLESVSVPSVTQPEAARALSYLISDAATCETVLGRPHAISHLFRFIYSLHPQSVKQQKKTKVLHDTAEVLKGKSMLVAAIMDIVTSSCDNPDTKIFRARLPEDADSGDIVAALQVIEEGGLQLDGPHDHDDEGDDRTGVRGIGIKILGGTTIIGALSLEDFLLDFLILDHCNNSRLSHFYSSKNSLSNVSIQQYSFLKSLFGNGGNAHVPVPQSSTKSWSASSVKSVASSKNFEYPGLWDDLHSRHVAVPLAAWALAGWALASDSNRSKILEFDRDGHAIMTALIAPERTVKWHGALITRLLLEDTHLPVVDFVVEWSSALLGMAVQASKAQDIPLAHNALSAFSVSIERRSDAQKYLMDKDLQLMREIAKQTQKDKRLQEVLAKALEVLATRKMRFCLEESQKWSGILLGWACGRLFEAGTRSSAAKILACILEEHGPDTVAISQAWLTLLLTDLAALSKITSVKRAGVSSKNKEAKASNTVQSQISQSAAQAATQLANIVVRISENKGETHDNIEALPLADLLMLDAFAEHAKAKKKDHLQRVDAADAAFATLKGIKALTELCSEDLASQKRIIESGGLYLLRRFMLSDDYEKLAATEAYDASRLLETHDEVSSSTDQTANSKTNNPSSVRVPPTAHIRKHAARLLTILSLQPDASKAIAEDEVWCQWLEDCADGKIPGCNDLKIRSYARATLLNISNAKYTGEGPTYSNGQGPQMNFEANICSRYEDMIFLINPESTYLKCETFKNLKMQQKRMQVINTDNSEYISPSSGSLLNINHEINLSERDSNSSIPLCNRKGTCQEVQEEVDPSLDVVFVHGLCGGPFKTWRVTDNKASTTSRSGLVEKIDQDAGREGTCWPREWLAVDLPRTRLLTVKYKTNLSQWSGATLPLEEVSSMLLNKLIAAGIGERPVVFVTHSMGGLVVKQMLFKAAKQKLTKLVNNTFGIVFYSCPHFGSKLADMPWRMGLVLRPAPSIGELRSGSPRLEELNNFVRRLHNKAGLQVLSFSETKVTPLVEGYGGWAFRMEVVPIESAYPGFGELVVLDGTDHINSCKPVSRTDPAYTETLRFLQKLQKNI